MATDGTITTFSRCPLSCVSSCDGRCCAVFPFPRTPREIAEKIEENGHYNGPDGWLIADMLIPLSSDEAKERCRRFRIDPSFVNLCEEQDLKLYTCRHWDENTHECGIYETRPGMCAHYPYGKACWHCGSGEDETQEEPWANVVTLGKN